MALGGSDARLVFRKRVYRHVHDIPNDPIEYHLLYAEAVNKVVKVGRDSNLTTAPSPQPQPPSPLFRTKKMGELFPILLGQTCRWPHTQ